VYYAERIAELHANPHRAVYHSPQPSSVGSERGTSKSTGSQVPSVVPEAGVIKNLVRSTKKAALDMLSAAPGARGRKSSSKSAVSELARIKEEVPKEPASEQTISTQTYSVKREAIVSASTQRKRIKR
jgi:hypothetical protein